MAINFITTTECKRLMETGQPLHILDVRTPVEFARIHAVGARLMPLDELDPAAVSSERGDSQEPILVICQSGGRAAKACERLQLSGLNQVYCIEGGTAAWEKMGLPVERGDTKVISLERQVRIGAGSLVLLGLALAWAIHPAFLAIPVIVGAGLVFAGITDYCGMAMVLGKMPRNKRAASETTTSAAFHSAP
jgi:rhodanese-related sulfurtransferase